jgi:hypothetical protein
MDIIRTVDKIMGRQGPVRWEINPREGAYQGIPATDRERELLIASGKLSFRALSIGVCDPRFHQGMGPQVAIIPLDESNIENARLIAAAPELLEALKQMVDSAHPHPVEHPTMTAAWEVARAAIAKAEGGAS